MANTLNSSEDYNYTQSSAQVDLLEALLSPSDACYPWNTTAPESEAYFTDQEQDFLLEDWSEEEMATRAETFFNQLEQIWSATTSSADNSDVASSNFIQACLQQQFATCIPQGWLDQIAHHAHRVFFTQKSLTDKLVQCVAELLPNWEEEDLLVLARPFAYAMRGIQTEAIEFVQGNVCTRDWTALSEIEQARTSLAIAQYALGKLQSDE